NFIPENKSNIKIHINHIKPSYTRNDTLEFSIKIPATKTNDSIVLYLNSKTIASKKLEKGKKFKLALNESRYGSNALEVKIKGENSSSRHHYNVKVFPYQKPKDLSYEIIAEYDHDTKDYTQGLIYDHEIIIESTGGYGSSLLKKYYLSTGALINSYELPKEYFGEGVTKLYDKLYQLTYKERKILVYNVHDLLPLYTADFISEGWGITNDGESLIVSDGTSKLYFLDPLTLVVKNTLLVFDHEGEVNKINELEYIKGEIYANIWFKNEIIAIDPTTGEVTKKLNFKELVKSYKKGLLSEKVLNGIAYDPDHDALLITGKRWPIIFKIKIFEEPTSPPEP
nr:glutaminyl-peptide cyclotransferase [Bacteroidota bacterium]